MLTKKETADYVKAGGGHCPFCNLSNLYYGDFDYEAGGIEQQVECLDCRKTWSDEYTLSGITPNED